MKRKRVSYSDFFNEVYCSPRRLNEKLERRMARASPVTVRDTAVAQHVCTLARTQSIGHHVSPRVVALATRTFRVLRVRMRCAARVIQRAALAWLYRPPVPNRPSFVVASYLAANAWICVE